MTECLPIVTLPVWAVFLLGITVTVVVWILVAAWREPPG